ncbi:hypothetical protein SAMN05192566_1557 [Methylophilus rhizosphaerae]|uniref:Uncharacterized protein n=1 Tax=Methylophilus rhizosphaerae TaxID=492660 RepID=A0A1G9CNV8_9PROT|nr:hypothetical protein [Methylophilus rhizosphaerae]SDK53403.1 hypothetical protein SAMN05192566_1557 [Methylophilus rhizosphaerae]
MVEINSFKQAHQLYKTNQFPLVAIQYLAFMFMNACQDIPPNISTYTDINTDSLTWLSGQLSAKFSFNEYLGGDAFICESETDLTAIVAFDQEWADQHGRWPNVTDKHLAWDICTILHSDWAVFGYCWNNAGGDIYYIPKSLWAKARVNEHRELSCS